ncbi:MAG: DNA/RNA nuclease SfsA [Hyphomicrobium sp.]|nr:DNA/RNA nuclease SfsA [Hyphomicrobium sp.]
MQFKTPLLRGRLVKRYKRFLADVILDDGREITATCPNTGSMMGLSQPGLAVWLSESASPTRKYAHTWELVELGDGKSRSFVGINTSHPNAIVSEAVTEGLIAPLSGYASMRREVKYGQSSRIDLLLEDPAKGLAYVEIKNVHLLREAGLAEFPDSKTERGVKHLAELTEMIRAGHRAVMIYLIQRGDAARFRPARDIDPKYADALSAARSAGVEAYAITCRLTPEAITVDRILPAIE